MEDIFQSEYSWYIQIVSSLVNIGLTENTRCFKVVMFHGLPRCVSFNYVINDENENIF